MIRLGVIELYNNQVFMINNYYYVYYRITD
jgi:hypothetical protein